MKLTETRMLMCRLSEDEQRMRGIDLADEHKRLGVLERFKRGCAEQIKDAEAKIDRLSETVKHRQEERNVVCTMTPDYEADTMTIRRTDTGEIVHIRQLTHQERQPELPGMPPAATANEDEQKARLLPLNENDHLAEMAGTIPAEQDPFAAGDGEMIVIDIPLPKKVKAKATVTLMRVGDQWAGGWAYQDKTGGRIEPAHKSNPHFASKAVAFSDAQLSLQEYAMEHAPDTAYEAITTFIPNF